MKMRITSLMSQKPKDKLASDIASYQTQIRAKHKKYKEAVENEGKRNETFTNVSLLSAVCGSPTE